MRTRGAKDKQHCMLGLNTIKKNAIRSTAHNQRKKEGNLNKPSPERSRSIFAKRTLDFSRTYSGPEMRIIGARCKSHKAGTPCMCHNTKDN